MRMCVEVLNGLEILLLLVKQVSVSLFSLLRSPSKVRREVTTRPEETYREEI